MRIENITKICQQHKKNVQRVCASRIALLKIGKFSQRSDTINILNGIVWLYSKGQPYLVSASYVSLLLFYTQARLQILKYGTHMGNHCVFSYFNRFVYFMAEWNQPKENMILPYLLYQICANAIHILFSYYFYVYLVSISW